MIDGISHPVGFISHCGDDVPALLLQGKNDVRQPGGLVQLDGLPTGDGLLCDQVASDHRNLGGGCFAHNLFLRLSY